MYRNFFVFNGLCDKVRSIIDPTPPSIGWLALG
jgi:hypothetical protein